MKVKPFRQRLFILIHIIIIVVVPIILGRLFVEITPKLENNNTEYIVRWLLFTIGLYPILFFIIYCILGIMLKLFIWILTGKVIDDIIGRYFEWLYSDWCIKKEKLNKLKLEDEQWIKDRDEALDELNKY